MKISLKSLAAVLLLAAAAQAEVKSIDITVFGMD
jgi:hypothetical protein